MSEATTLRTLLADVNPNWYGDLDPTLLTPARDSAIGRRLLARWLASEHADALLAPAPDKRFASAATRWPRARLAALVRDLGALAFAPPIRAEIRREPVRFFKQALGTSYLLALDQTVWDGRIGDALAAQLSASMASALAADDHEAAFGALLDRQGRVELRAWARQHEAAFAQWVLLLFPPEDEGAAHLPEQPVLRLIAHHESKPLAA